MVAIRDRPLELATIDTCYKSVHMQYYEPGTVFTCLLFGYRTRWAIRDGILYKVPCVLTVRVEDDYPQFGRVESIYVVNTNSVYFHLRLMNTLDFNIHRHLYIVEVACSYKTVCFADLYYVFPLHLRQATVNNSSCLCVIPKHHILHSLQQ